jgi:hypothetical protein
MILLFLTLEEWKQELQEQCFLGLEYIMEAYRSLLLYKLSLNPLLFG